MTAKKLNSIQPKEDAEQNSTRESDRTYEMKEHDEPDIIIRD